MPNQRRQTIRYPGDISELHFEQHETSVTACRVLLSALEENKRKLRSAQQQKRRLDKKIESLEGVIEKLKDKNLISENSGDVLQVNFSKIFNIFFISVCYCYTNCKAMA